jgi:hypothetical protein
MQENQKCLKMEVQLLKISDLNQFPPPRIQAPQPPDVKSGQAPKGELIQAPQPPKGELKQNFQALVSSLLRLFSISRIQSPFSLNFELATLNYSSPDEPMCIFPIKLPFRLPFSLNFELPTLNKYVL